MMIFQVFYRYLTINSENYFLIVEIFELDR